MQNFRLYPDSFLSVFFRKYDLFGLFDTYLWKKPTGKNQDIAKFHDEKNIFVVDFGENVDFALIPLGLLATKSIFFGQNQPIKTRFGGISRIFFLFYEQIHVYAAVCKIS